MFGERNSINSKEVRDLRDGDWYWLDKKILELYAQKLMVSGLAVYNALAFFADSQTQQCFPAQKRIAQLLGLSRRTVVRKIKLLKELGLVAVEKSNSSFRYSLLEPPSGMTDKIQGCDKRDAFGVTPGNINNNSLTRTNNNNDGDKRFFDSGASKRSTPGTREELLAGDIAIGLNDDRNLPRYLACAQKYSESLLRGILGEVKEVPAEKLKKGRAALFHYLLKKYAQASFTNPRA